MIEQPEYYVSIVFIRDTDRRLKEFNNLYQANNRTDAILKALEETLNLPEYRDYDMSKIQAREKGNYLNA